MRKEGGLIDQLAPAARASQLDNGLGNLLLLEDPFTLGLQRCQFLFVGRTWQELLEVGRMS